MRCPIALLALIFLISGYASAWPIQEQARTHRKQFTVGGDRAQIELWEQEGGSEPGPRYRITLADGRDSQPRPARHEVALRRERFDPLREEPKFTASLFGSALDYAGSIHIVQFVTQPLAAYEEELVALGATSLRFLPQQAQLVRMTPAVRKRVEALPFVRWIGPYHPEYRLAPELLLGLEREELPANGRYLVQLFERGPEMARVVGQRIEALGASPITLCADGFFLGAILEAETLAALASWDEVLYVDRWGEPQTMVAKVRVDGGANFIEAQLGYTGQGVRAEVLDLGVLATHQDFQSPPPIIHNSIGIPDHGTSVAGIVFGDGTGNARARGILPDAQPIFAGVINGAFDLQTQLSELGQPPYEAVFQTNSWGYIVGPAYDNWSTMADDAVFLYDVTLLYAHGNGGNNTEVNSFAWGKNVVSVGGIQHLNTQTVADDQWAQSGSTGPAEDGRIKPDLAHWNDSILTADTGGGYTRDFGGTSAAAPQTAGYFGLMFQMWHEGLFGNPTAASVFASRPKASLAKALMINTARQYDFSGLAHDKTRLHQGWGRANVQRLYEKRDGLFLVNEDVVLRNLESASFVIDVAVGEPELRATLAFLDPAGTTSAALHRINDLSLRLSAPSGLRYWGNHGLASATTSVPGGNPNTIDTVENVWLESPEAGSWIVEVFAHEVNQDTHLETPAVDADFALVVSGVAPCASPINYCAATLNSAGSAAMMGFAGSQSILAGDFTLETHSLPAGTSGLFYFGASPANVPLGNGFRCVGGQLFRLPVVFSDGVGFASLDLFSAGSALVIDAGTTWNFQFWYRDPAAGGSYFNLSDGLSVEFCE
ncbi:MAG: serine protease AprX [Planctomycetota bacterium]|jgi:serine protease AprX